MLYMRLHRTSALFLFPIAILVGCGGPDRPPMGYVSGVVSVDGEPFGGVIVSFKPENGRPATATTDDDGKYDLRYTANEYGCKIGPNSVSFFSPTGGATTHAIPPKFQKDAFQVDVVKGRNTFDFDLESDAVSAKKLEAEKQKKAVPNTD